MACVVFLHEIPDTSKGHTLLVTHELITSVTANQLDGSLKRLRKRLLTECGIERS